MPLTKSPSKKAFKHNVKVEMEAHPGNPKRDLAIAYSVKRKAKKASGGTVAYGAKDMNMAKGGKMPDKMTTNNSSGPQYDHTGTFTGHKKPMKQPAASAEDLVMGDKKKGSKAHYAEGGMIDKESATTAQRGPKTTRIKHPSMAQSPVFKVRMRDEEDHLEDSDAPASPEEHIRAPMAKGGKINDFEDMDDAEEDNAQHPAHLEEDDDMMGDAEAMDDHMDMYARGGDIDGNREQMDDHEDSMAAAIMARRDRMHADIDSGAYDLDHAVQMAEGGEVDIDMNAEEQPNDFYHQNEDAVLKENYDSDLDDVSQPMDSNTQGHEIDSDEYDMADKIHRQMKAKRQFKGR